MGFRLRAWRARFRGLELYTVYPLDSHAAPDLSRSRAAVHDNSVPLHRSHGGVGPWGLGGLIRALEAFGA